MMVMANENGSTRGSTAAVPSRPSPPARLPVELILRILWDAAQLTKTTSETRDICLVSRAAYEQCWPCLWRIVALRNAKQLKAFSDAIYRPPHADDGDEGVEDGNDDHDYNNDDDEDSKATRPHAYTDASERRLRRKQDAVQYLYLNNNKDAAGLRELQTDEKPEMWMISILLAARHLKVLHAEEYWSMSYPWESQEEKPLVAYPLMLLSRFSTAVHAAMIASPNAAWVRRMFGRRHRHTQHHHHNDEEEADAQQPPLTLEESIEQRAAAITQAPKDMYNAIITLQRNEQRRRGGDASSRLLAQPSEVTLSALAMSPTHLSRTAVVPSHWSPDQQLPPNNDAFLQLSHLHLYFAKLDTRLIEVLQELPALTHLRLTRPFSELLIDGIETMLQHKRSGSGVERGDGGEASPPLVRSRLQRLIVEAGMYMDKSTVKYMRSLEKSEVGRDRLVFLSNSLFQTGPYRAAEMDTVAVGGAGNDTSTSRVINYVTNSEERGYRDFVNRAQQRDGVWEVPFALGDGGSGRR